ncbi:MAG: hypothetical protein H7281_16815 [Bacteriovorax sp.]|nr:hypothetical protein [Bacteriovorax sp.]
MKLPTWMTALKVSPEFKAKGFIAKEKGHMPNPTVALKFFLQSFIAKYIKYSFGWFNKHMRNQSGYKEEPAPTS